ncbi:hypothetical protein [Sulfurovum sp.]|uniref:hypothetical protein n=1 Tax=Sulfurovum sp. TaxID=1969726 RepID=UPI0025FD79CE|nr:hypothetical protein [Sulfurovum sp.]
MRNLLWVLTIMLLYVGCTSKEQKALMQTYEKEKVYHKKLQKTEKVQLYEGAFTKAMLTATYLNGQSIEKNDKHDEQFIVGVYIEESDMPSIDGEGYTLLLNGHPPKSIKALKEGDALLKDISFVSQWSKFYLVTFPHISSKSFKLVFNSDLYGKGELHFAKVAKYVLNKKPY